MTMNCMDARKTKTKKKQKSTKTTVADSKMSMGWKHMIGVWGDLIWWFALDDRKRFDWTIINSESHRRSKTRNNKTENQDASQGNASHMNTKENILHSSSVVGGIAGGGAGVMAGTKVLGGPSVSGEPLWAGAMSSTQDLFIRKGMHWYLCLTLVSPSFGGPLWWEGQKYGIDRSWVRQVDLMNLLGYPWTGGQPTQHGETVAVGHGHWECSFHQWQHQGGGPRYPVK